MPPRLTMARRAEPTGALPRWRRRRRARQRGPGSATPSSIELVVVSGIDWLRGTCGEHQHRPEPDRDERADHARDIAPAPPDSSTRPIAANTSPKNSDSRSARWRVIIGPPHGQRRRVSSRCPSAGPARTLHPLRADVAIREARPILPGAEDAELPRIRPATTARSPHRREDDAHLTRGDAGGDLDRLRGRLHGGQVEHQPAADQPILVTELLRARRAEPMEAEPALDRRGDEARGDGERQHQDAEQDQQAGMARQVPTISPMPITPSDSPSTAGSTSAPETFVANARSRWRRACRPGRTSRAAIVVAGAATRRGTAAALQGRRPRPSLAASLR